MDTPKAPEGQVADAAKDNWVDLYAPAWSRPYLRLSRADRPIGTWLLYIPCLWSVLLAAGGGAVTWFDLWLALSMGAGAFLMRGAGCTWNDITDRHIDAKVARTKSRPLPSGQVSVRQALVWMVLQALVAFGILLSYGMPTIAVGVASLFFVCIYPFAKRFTWWPQAFLGLAFNWGALLGWAAHSGHLPVAAGLLYLSGIAWTLFYDTIYAHQDAEDDALIGVKSTARLFGSKTKPWLWGFALLSALLMETAVLLARLTQMQSLLASIGVLGFFAHMVWQMRQLDIQNNTLLLRLFHSNRDAGFIAVLFFAVAAFL